MTYSGGPTSGLGGIMSGLVQGGQTPGTVVGQETPEWDFPYGADRVPDDVRSIFLRSDAGPTGLNEFIQQEMKKNPGIIDRLRSMINMGIMRPKNAAAQNLTTGYGGYRAGDMTALGPMINGMPSGLNDSQLNTLANIINSGIQYNLGLIQASGYLDGMPTLERQKVMDELAQGWMKQATDQFLASETATHNRATEGIDQQKVTNDNIQNMAKIFGGQMTTDPATGQSTFQPTEEARQFNTEQSGYLDGQATLTREQQAFNQAKDVANLASNPRNYIEAQMLANSRGGLTGMEPNNQVQQTTFGPPTTAGQMPQFQTPGGQFNQLPNLSTMQGQPEQMMQEQTAPGGQQGVGFNTPTPQGQAATGQYDLNNPNTWQSFMGNAQGLSQNAMDQLRQMQQTAGWKSLQPQAGQLPAGIGAQQPPPYPGLPTGYGQGQPEPYRVGGFQVPGSASTDGAMDMQRGEVGNAYDQMLRANGQTPTGSTDGAMDMQRGEVGNTYNQMMLRANGQTPTGGQNLMTQFGNLSNMGGALSGVQRARQVASPMASFNRGQDVAGANQGQKFATSNFTQSLLQNRVVPKAGGLATAGQYMTADQMRSQFNPNKIRTQDYLRGENSQQAGFRAVGSMAGYSDDDLQGIMQKNLPTFKAPTAGKMI